MWFDFENMLTWNIKIWLLFSEFSLPTSYMSESGICHYCFTENARKLLWSRIKSPGIHLSDGLNTPVINFLTSKSSIVLFINGYQSWPIIHPSNPIPCLHPSIPPSHPNPKKRCCRVQMFDNSKVHIHFFFSISHICWLCNWWIITQLPLPALFHLLKLFLFIPFTSPLACIRIDFLNLPIPCWRQNKRRASCLG